MSAETELTSAAMDITLDNKGLSVSAEEIEAALHVEMIQLEETLLQYSYGFGKPDYPENGVTFNRQCFPIGPGMDPRFHGNPEEVAKQLEQDLSIQKVVKAVDAEKLLAEKPSAFEEDSDGEVMPLCSRCGLPIGECGYHDEQIEGLGKLVHGECVAQLLQQEVRESDEARKREETARRKAEREQYDIGWKAERVPNNLLAAEKLECGFVPKGMCCLALEEGHIRVLPTTEPAAAVNLEYLSIALQVRLLEGKEPFFSLDPVNKGEPIGQDDPKSWMQTKRFEPEWLAGTSAGEVMFQADYHLKELSMGACEQPVVGMKSCFDYIEKDGQDQDWRAREWFVVRKAEVQLSEDNVLMPFCKMGVEAREQKWTENGLEDSKLTRPDHPLVKYAEQFTLNFDLIAERKSVIHHLRELAKASILAKFLLEAEIPLDDIWFNLDGESRIDCHDEVPQLWNDRIHSKIKLEDGRIANEDKPVSPKWNSVWGGVQFGLEKFSLSAMKPAARIAAPRGQRVAIPSEPITTSRSPITFGAARFGKAVGIPASFRPQAPAAAAPPPTAVTPAAPEAPAAVSSAVRPAAPVWQPPAETAAAAVSAMSRARESRLGRVSTYAASAMSAMSAAPQGVDLNLNSFDLSDAKVVTAQVAAADWGTALEGGVAIARGFWSCVDEDGTIFSEGDKQLLQEIFNPNLSDRRDEGDLFQPPDSSYSHVKKLRALTKEEEMVRAHRKAHFLSDRFVMGDASDVFPLSWTSSYEIARGRATSTLPPQGGRLLARPDYKAQAHAFDHVLQTAVPVFDRCTEDGMRFRIYRFGSLEVRTTQERQGQEIIGVVYSMRTSARAGFKRIWGFTPEAQETITKAYLYVAAGQLGGDAEQTLKKTFRRRYYVVLETEQGNFIVTERLRDGSLTWEENPDDLEDVNSLARIVRHAECKASVSTVREFQAETQKGSKSRASNSERKAYAQDLYCLMTGQDLAGLYVEVSGAPRATYSAMTKIKFSEKKAEEESLGQEIVKQKYDETQKALGFSETDMNEFLEMKKSIGAGVRRSRRA